MSRCEVALTSAVPSALLSLLDHEGRTVASAAGALNTTTEPGIYRVQIDTGSRIKQELLAVYPGQKVDQQIDAEAYSVTPVRDTVTYHGHHGIPARTLSREPTVFHGAGSRLVVFVRIAVKDDDSHQTLDVAGLRILNQDLEPIVSHESQWESGPGYAAVSIDIDPGNYVLRAPVIRGLEGLTAAHTSDQTLTCSRGWTTLSFVPFLPTEGGRSQHGPQPQLMTVHMAPVTHGFEPYDEGADVILSAEMALQGLRSGQALLPLGGTAQVMRDLHSNPMLGLYAAHALLLGHNKRRDKEAEALIRELRRTMPGHPDAEAFLLLLKTRRHNTTHSRVKPFDIPPMLRASYQAVIMRDATEPGIIGEGSLAEQASTLSRMDGVWARWDTIQPVDEHNVQVDLPLLDDAAVVIRDLIDTKDLPPASSDASDAYAASGLIPQEITHLADYVRELSKYQGALDDVAAISVNDLSRQIGLPVAKVEKGLRAIGDASSLELF